MEDDLIDQFEKVAREYGESVNDVVKAAETWAAQLKEDPV